MPDEIIAEHGQGRHSAERSACGFQQQQVQQERVHSAFGSGQRYPTSAARASVWTADNGVFHESRNEPVTSAAARSARERLHCDLISSSAAANIMPTAAAVIAAIAAPAYAFADHVSYASVIRTARAAVGTVTTATATSDAVQPPKIQAEPAMNAIMLVPGVTRESPLSS